jgi:hypothetical protein
MMHVKVIRLPMFCMHIVKPETTAIIAIEVIKKKVAITAGCQESRAAGV